MTIEEENENIFGIEKILIETLEGKSYGTAKTISQEYGLGILIGSAEAVSRLIRRNLRMNELKQEPVLLGYDGSVYLN